LNYAECSLSYAKLALIAEVQPILFIGCVSAIRTYDYRRAPAPCKGSCS
jgi:hypothetical protein